METTRLYEIITLERSVVRDEINRPLQIVYEALQQYQRNPHLPIYDAISIAAHFKPTVAHDYVQKMAKHMLHKFGVTTGLEILKATIRMLELGLKRVRVVEDQAKRTHKMNDIETMIYNTYRRNDPFRWGS